MKWLKTILLILAFTCVAHAQAPGTQVDPSQIKDFPVTLGTPPAVPFYNVPGAAIVGPSNVYVLGAGFNSLGFTGPLYLGCTSLPCTPVNVGTFAAPLEPASTCVAQGAGFGTLCIADAATGLPLYANGTGPFNPLAVQNFNATFANLAVTGPRPYIDVTAAPYLASGSGQTTTGGCVSGVPSLTLASAIDFVNGEGVQIFGCGALSTLTKPTVTVVPQGSTGSTNYYYTVAAVDAGGGAGGYNTAIEITNGNATLSGTNYNAIHFTPVANARGYVLIGRGAAPTTQLQFMPWEDPTAYTGATAARSGNFVTLTVAGVGATVSVPSTWFVTITACSDATLDGTFQVLSTGANTVIWAQTDANTTATGCTMTVDPTFFDFGTTFPLPGNLNIGASATNGYFAATITSGAGTTAVSLSGSPSVNAAGQPVSHDDTASWNAAITAAMAAQTPLYCPVGQYNISADLLIASGFTLRGAAYEIATQSCWIKQYNPGADIFRGGYPAEALGVKITDVTLTGGRIGLDSVLPGGTSVLQTDGVTWQSYIGLRASANMIQVTLKHNYVQTSDWGIDVSPAASIQGFKIDTGWFGGTGNGVWHDVRVPGTNGGSTGFSFNDILWEGPTAAWMVGSATPVGARNIFGNVTGLVFKNAQLADPGTSAVNWLQTMPSTDGYPGSIEFENGNLSADSNAYLVYVEANGTSLGPNLIFNGGLYTGMGIWANAGSSAPISVVNLGGSFTPALPTTHLMTIGTAFGGGLTTYGGNTSSTYATTTNCAGVGTSASPSVATCGAAAAGLFSCATNATGATCTVNTTAVTANSEIFVFESDTATTGTALGVTCNTNTDVLPTSMLLASSVAATSFTINLGTVTTHPACFSYHIVN